MPKKPTKSARLQEVEDTSQLFASGQPITIRATQPGAIRVATEGAGCALKLTRIASIEVRLASRLL